MSRCRTGLPLPGRRGGRLPCRAAENPGRDRRTLISRLCGLDYLAALVVAAVGADRVRSPGVLAVGARLDLDQRQRQVRAAPSLLRFGELDLGQCHEVEKFT